jgi:hypothetical protein
VANTCRWRPYIFDGEIFGLCFLLRFRFAPRIRDLPDRRLFTFESPEQYTALQDLIADQVDASLVERNWDELLRMAESIRKGKVSASLLVSKLAAYPQHSEVGLPCGNSVASNELCSRWIGFRSQNSVGGPIPV